MNIITFMNVAWWLSYTWQWHKHKKTVFNFVKCKFWTAISNNVFVSEARDASVHFFYRYCINKLWLITGIEPQRHK